MKTMIYSLALAAFMSLGSCNDNDDPILTQKDWDGTATYFASTDEQFTTYYNRMLVMQAIRCRFMIR